MIAILSLCGLLLLPAVNAQSQVGQERRDTVFSLLDRIDRLVSSARKQLDTDDLVAVGTTGSSGNTTGSSGKTGKLPISAADLDEIRAEIAQIKSLLKAEGEK